MPKINIRNPEWEKAVYEETFLLADGSKFPMPFPRRSHKRDARFDHPEDWIRPFVTIDLPHGHPRLIRAKAEFSDEITYETKPPINIDQN